MIISWQKILVFQIRIKHIDIELHYHYIREMNLEGYIKMVPTNIDDKITRIFTKTFKKAKFDKFHEALVMIHRTTLQRSFL
jgi:hypothetical protein